MSNHSWLHYTCGSIFGIVALVHLTRILMSWTLMIQTWMAPMWLSWFGFIAPGILAIWLLKTA